MAKQGPKADCHTVLPENRLILDKDVVAKRFAMTNSLSFEVAACHSERSMAKGLAFGSFSVIASAAWRSAFLPSPCRCLRSILPPSFGGGSFSFVAQGWQNKDQRQIATPFCRKNCWGWTTMQWQNGSQ